MTIKLTIPSDEAVLEKLEEQSEDDLSEESVLAFQPPPVLLMKRKQVRIFGNRGVALYYSDALGRYISIPFGPDTIVAEETE